MGPVFVLALLTACTQLLGWSAPLQQALLHGRLAAAAVQWRASRPAALQACSRNIFWASLETSSRAAAQTLRLDYIVGYGDRLAGLEVARGHGAFDVSPSLPYLVCAHRLTRYGERTSGALAGTGENVWPQISSPRPPPPTPPLTVKLF